VVVIDAGLSGVDGIEVTRELSSRPDVAVMVLISSDDTDDTLAAVRAGATGVLLKDTEPADLADHVEALARGEARLSPR
jgi:DNA-binding NarL/FixJ family response regulator